MVAPTQTSLVVTYLDNNVALYTWTALASASSGDPISGPGWTDRSVQVVGLFDAATMVLQGSNDKVNWFTLHYSLCIPASAPNIVITVNSTACSGCSAVDVNAHGYQY